MVITIVHEDCVAALETESHPPVAVDSNRPVACELSLERVKMPSWQIHGNRFLCRIQSRQLMFQPSRMGWLDTCFRSSLEEPLQAGMPERSNHLDYCIV